MEKSGYRYTVVDGLVLDPVEKFNPVTRVKTIDFVSTGITARRFIDFAEGRMFPLTGYETDRAGVLRAANLLQAKYPKAVIGFRNAARVADGATPMITNWGYSGAMITLTGPSEESPTVIINPLQILMRDYAGRVRNGESTLDEYADEIRRTASGLLADIL